jgi:predicted Zn finger-like uncharacterized protein
LPYGGGVIVTCPQCAAQYRLDVSVVMRRPRLKCADCGLRWAPAEEIDEDEAVAAVQEEVRAARNPPPPPPEPDAVPEPEPELEPEPERTSWGKWLLAVALGAALATASIGLWIGRIEPESLPGVSELLGRVAPPLPRLDVAVAALVTRLPTEGAILEVTGTIANPGRVAAPVPALRARLLADGETAREWTIPPPAAMIAPGQRLAFASTITDVPAGAITVQVHFARNRL